jgi:hypothetical protein
LDGQALCLDVGWLLDGEDVGSCEGAYVGAAVAVSARRMLHMVIIVSAANQWQPPIVVKGRRR